MKKIILMILVTFALIISGCGSSGGNENEVVLKSITLKNSAATVELNEIYSLGTTATANYSDGTTKSVNIVWDKVVDSSKIVTNDVYTAVYTEGDITVSAEFKLTVVASRKLESIVLPYNVMTVLKMESVTLPTTATAVFTDKSTETVNIVWDKAVDTSDEGNDIYVASYVRNGITVTANLKLVVEVLLSTDKKVVMSGIDSMAVGSEVSYNVVVNGITDTVLGIDVRFLYDSTMFDFVSAEFQSTWGNTNQFVINKEDDDNNPGTRVIATVKAAAEAEVMSGTVLKITLKAKKTGTTNLRFGEIDILDSTGIGYIKNIDFSYIKSVTVY